MSSEYILLTLTFEVYLAIVHPVRHKNLITTRFLIICVVFVVLGATVYHLAYNMATTLIIDGTCNVGKIWASSEWKSAYACINFTVKLLFPLLFFVFCYIHMAISLKHSKVSEEASLPTEIIYNYIFINNQITALSD